MGARACEGRVAVVTGSARNIGRACVEALAAEGAKVVVNARSRDRVDEIVARIQSAGGEALPSYDSIETQEGVEALIATAVNGFGSVDILVNNAAIGFDALLHEMPEEEWQAVLNVNLTGVFRACKAAL